MSDSTALVAVAREAKGAQGAGASSAMVTSTKYTGGVLVAADQQPARSTKRAMPSAPFNTAGFLGDGPAPERAPAAGELIRRPMATFMSGKTDECDEGHERGLGKDKAYMADRIESHWLAMAGGDEKKEQQLALMMPPPASRPKKKRRKMEVLDEDTYVESLTKIITRDFFPDLPKLRQQVEVLDALEANDTERLRELQARYSQQRSAERSMQRGGASSARSVGASPLDTPGSMYAPTPLRDGEEAARGAGAAQGDTDADGAAQPVNTGLSLDAFNRKYTSEDNEAFEEILEKDQDKQWEKIKWMHEAAHKYAIKQFLLKNAPQDPTDPQDRPAMLEGWDFKARNQLIWNPSDGKNETNVVLGPPKVVVHGNTRLRPSVASTSSGGGQTAATAYGSVNARGVDSNADRRTAESPKVGGFGFVATPSMSPGVGESPLMTWGDLGSTPMRLDVVGDVDPLSVQGPSFTIPAYPGRDEVGRELDNEVNKRKRKAAKKREAASSKRRQSSERSGSRFSASRGSARASVGLSPAAQRLLNSTPGRSKGGFGDSQLRKSYTVRPSSSSRQHSSGSGGGSSRRSGSTSTARSSSGATPVAAAAAGLEGAPLLPQGASVTDNLLNL